MDGESGVEDGEKREEILNDSRKRRIRKRGLTKVEGPYKRGF